MSIARLQTVVISGGVYRKILSTTTYVSGFLAKNSGGMLCEKITDCSCGLVERVFRRRRVLFQSGLTDEGGTEVLKVSEITTDSAGWLNLESFPMLCK